MRISTLLALAVLSGASSARANAAAAFWRTPGAAGGAWVDGPSPVLVTHEDLRITCREVDHDATCTFVATYSLLNSSSASVSIRGAFYGTSDASIELDGRSVRVDGADRKALDAVEESAVATPDATTHTTSETPFELTTLASAQGTLVFRGKLDPTYGERRGGQEGFLVFPAYRVRHPVVSGEGSGPRRFEFQYLVYPLRSWAGPRAVHVELRWPGSWDYAHPALDGAPPFAIARGSENVATVDADGARAGTLGMAFRLAARTIVDGGPFIGAGGQFEPKELRLRAGWEIAGPSAVSYSLAAETNAKDRFLVAAVVEASLPNLFLLIPGLGIGAGPEVGWSSVTGAYGGARLQASLSWPFLTLVAPVDIVAPSFTTGTDKIVVGSLLGQLSF